MKALPEIKRCPFCGSRAAVDDCLGQHTEGLTDAGKQVFGRLALLWNVYCLNGIRCGVFGPIRKTKRGAINAWNSGRDE